MQAIHDLDVHTLLIEHVPICLNRVIGQMDFTDTGICIAIPEEVGFTLDGLPAVGNLVTSPVKVNSIPMTGNQDLIRKLIGLAVHGQGAFLEGLISIGHEVVVDILVHEHIVIGIVVHNSVQSGLPAGNQLAQLSVVQLAVVLNEAQIGGGSGFVVGAVLAEDVDNIVHDVGAGQGNAINIVLSTLSIPAVADHDAINIFLAIGINTGEGLAASALQHAVDDLVGVAGSRNDGAPVDDGGAAALVALAVHISSCLIDVLHGAAVTANAEDSAGVSGGGAGSSLILSGAGDMDVGAPLVLTDFLDGSGGVFHDVVPVGIVMAVRTVTVHLGQSMMLLSGEGIGGAVNKVDLTRKDLNFHSVHTGTVGVPHTVGGHHLVGVDLTGIGGNDACVNIGLLGVAHGSPDTDGQLCQHSLAGNLNITGASDGNVCNIQIIDSVGSLEAVGNLNALQIPGADVIQLDGSGDGLNIFNILCDQIVVQHGAQRHQRGIRIGRNQSDLAVGLVDDDLTGDGAHVAGLVSNLKTEGVNTIAQLHTVSHNGAISSAGDTAGDLLAVQIDLGGGNVQAGSIDLCGVLGSIGNHGDGIGGDRLAVHCDLAVGSFGNISAGEGGVLTILNRRREVSGDVVDVEGVILIGIPDGVIRVGDLDIQCSDLVEIRHVYLEIIPAILGRLNASAVEVLPLKQGNRLDRRVTGGGDGGIGTEGQLQVAHFLHANVDPHTDGGSAGHIQSREVQHNGLGTGCSANTEVSIDCQSLLTIANLASSGVDHPCLTALHTTHGTNRLSVVGIVSVHI